MIFVVGFSITAPLATESAAWVGSAVAFAVATAGTPGPNNAMLASSGSLWGFRRTVPHMLGVAIGFPVMLVAVAAGGGQLLLHHPAVLDILRWLGAAYLLYLAWRIARADPQKQEEQRRTRAGSPLNFLQASLFQWINPKAWLITVSALATLTSVSHRPSLSRAALLALLFLLVDLPITAFWTSLGVGVSRVLGNRRALRRFNLAMAALLVVSVVSVLAGLS